MLSSAMNINRTCYINRKLAASRTFPNPAEAYGDLQNKMFNGELSPLQASMYTGIM